MKRILVATAISILAALYVGYYEAVEEADLEIVIFIKKHPSFQVKFYNIHANDGDYRELDKITTAQRKRMIDYCRFRLGIDTDLKTQADVEMCSKR